jgi:trigger factor
MAAAIESLGAIERRFHMAIPMATVDSEVGSRLARMSRTVKMAGFRQGKVPLKMVAASYGPQVRAEVLGDEVNKQFGDTITTAKLKVAGFPRIEPRQYAEGEKGSESELEFTATFEIYPDVQVGDLGQLAVERATAQVGEADIDKTLDVLRKQRVKYEKVDRAGAKDDRVTIDFVGTLDGVEFQGGKSENFPFVLGAGQMLPEFDTGATGLKAGESRTFDVKFPEDYHGKDVAGKTAQFKVTVQSVEGGVLPALDAEFAKSLGVPDGDLTKMRADVRGNLEREVKKRLSSRLKTSVMDALYQNIKFEVPKSLVEQDIQRLSEQAQNDLKARGISQPMALPPEIFAEQAKKRVSLGLILSEVVKSNELEAKPEQVRAMVDDFAQSYEDPREVIRWYYGDNKRLAEVEAVVLEENVVQYVVSQAKVSDKALGFDELMGNNNG